METTVVNLNDYVDELGSGLMVRIDRMTKWGNPFRVGQDGDREAVIEKYRQWLWGKIRREELDLYELADLLGCELGYRDGEVLGELLGCDPAEIRHEKLPERKPYRRKHPTRPIATVPEVTVEAAAGAGAFESGFETETARWGWPANMIRHEGGADPENLRIIRVRGDSMEPDMREGDRIAVDVSQKTPATGETFVLWDGSGIVVKKVDVAPGEDDDPRRLRLVSENPEYPPYTRLADDVHFLGKALWVVRRV